MPYIIYSVLHNLQCPTSSATSYIINKVPHHQQCPISSAVPYSIYSVLRHLQCPRSSTVSYVIYSILNHQQRPTLSTVSYIIYGLASSSVSYIGYIVLKQLSYLHSLTSTASYRIYSLSQHIQRPTVATISIVLCIIYCNYSIAQRPKAVTVFTHIYSGLQELQYFILLIVYIKTLSI